MIEAACEPLGARPAGPHPRGAAPTDADAGQRPALPGDDQRRALFHARPRTGPRGGRSHERNNNLLIINVFLNTI